MGEFKLRLPRFWDFQPHHARTLHVIGLDGIPWQCRVQHVGDILTIVRHRDKSGRIHIVWPFAERGELLIQTGTLPERATPWPLALELARGTLNRLRNQLSIWQEGELRIPPTVGSRQQSAVESLGSAIFCSNPERQDELARESLEWAMDALFDLGDAYADQVSQFRIAAAESAPFWMAAATTQTMNLDWINSEPTFDLIGYGNPQDPDAVPLPARYSKPIIYGPLLDASPGGLPADAIHSDDFDNRQRNLLNHYRQQLAQMPEETSLVHAACGLNGIGHRHLSFPQQMQVTADLLRMIGDHDNAPPTMVSFDFPWAERLAWSVGGTHPLQVADSLLRQALPLNYLGLDINLDYWPQGSVARDPLQWIDLIDIWSQFGLPLILCLRFPRQPLDAAEELSGETNSIRPGLSAQQRRVYLQTVLPMMIARPQVHGILFRQAFDADDTRFPLAGLVSSNVASPAAPTWLAQIRETYWIRD